MSPENRGIWAVVDQGYSVRSLRKQPCRKGCNCALLGRKETEKGFFLVPNHWGIERRFVGQALSVMYTRVSTRNENPVRATF